MRQLSIVQVYSALQRPKDFLSSSLFCTNKKLNSRLSNPTPEILTVTVDISSIVNLYLSIFIYALNPILDLDIHGIQRGRLDLNENVLVIDDLGDLNLLYSDSLDYVLHWQIFKLTSASVKRPFLIYFCYSILQFSRLFTTTKNRSEKRFKNKGKALP